jgi:hypothetical protein
MTRRNAFVQQFVYRPDRAQDSVLLAAHSPKGGQLGAYPA